jgi:hypothetical protein
LPWPALWGEWLAPFNITGCCMYWRQSRAKRAWCRQCMQLPLCLAPRRAGARGQPWGVASGGWPRAQHQNQCGHGCAITASHPVRRYAPNKDWVCCAKARHGVQGKNCLARHTESVSHSCAVKAKPCGSASPSLDRISAAPDRRPKGG